MGSQADGRAPGRGRYRREVRKTSVIFALIIVYAVAGMGIRIMKKLQPDDKIYPVWAVIICILLTLFIGYHVF